MSACFSRVARVVANTVVLVPMAMTVGSVAAQPQPSPGPVPYPTPVRLSEAPLTFAQVLSRQKANYDRMKQGRGHVVWTEERADPAAPAGAVARPRPGQRMVFFLFETTPERSVNLVLPMDAARSYLAGGRIDWLKALSAVAIEGDRVSTVGYARGTSTPIVTIAPFNPAVHESNPLVAFHPRLLGDDKDLRLADLAAAKPRLTEALSGGRRMIRIDAEKPGRPGEQASVTVDPAKACLPVEIVRTLDGRMASRATIVVGNTPDGTFIPARRTTERFDTAGRVVSRETWYYEDLSLNGPMPRLGATIAFFGLPDSTQVVTLGGQDGAKPSVRRTAPALR